MSSEIEIVVPEIERSVSGLVDRPEDGGTSRGWVVLAHGAGAGMDHRFLAAMGRELTDRGFGVLRYQFPYMEERARSGGRRPPDRKPVLLATARAALARGRELAGPDGLLLAAGKSMGGRMTSELAVADPALFDRLGVAGIAFLGFPLHPPKRPEKAPERARHLAGVRVPTLFLQGTRDPLADLDLLRPAVEQMDSPATLHVVDGADHGFAVLQRSGRTAEEVLAELADTIASWSAGGALTPQP
jgi:predicted alpha/beta-hydrolase family hydrolase